MSTPTTDPAQYLGEPDVVSTFSDITGSFYTRKAALDAVQRALAAQQQELERLTAALKKANDQAEHFERAWYLRGDALEKLEQWAEAYPVEVFPEVLRQEWQQANEVLAQAGLSMSRMSASNMRHVITQTKAIVAAGLAAGQDAQQEPGK